MYTSPMSAFGQAIALGWLLSCGGPATPDWRAQLGAWEWPEPVPPFALVDQRGRSFTLADLEDRWVLVGFVFTHCGQAEACPLTMHRMAEVRDAWRQAAGPRAGELALLSITLDPARDTPERLAEWGARWGAGDAQWRLATGPVGLVDDALPNLFGVLSLPDGHGGFTHTVKLALLRPGLAIEAEWTENAVRPDQIVDRVLGSR